MNDELPLDAVLAQLSERGRVEWDLAVTKGLLARERERSAELLARLEQHDRNQEGS